MFAYYAAQGLSLLDRLNDLYSEYGYCLNTLHSYEFEGSAGFNKMQNIMKRFREGIEYIGPKQVLQCLDYSEGIDHLPKSDVLKYLLEGDCSVVIRPSGTEPKLKVYISVSAGDRMTATDVENLIVQNLQEYFR